MATLYITNPEPLPLGTGGSRGVWFATNANQSSNYEAFVPGADVNLDEIEIFANFYETNTPPSDFQVSLYADAGGSAPAPGQLIAVLEGPATPKPDAYSSYLASTALSLEQGVRYWLGFELAAANGNSAIRVRQGINNGNFSLSPGWTAPIHRVVRNGTVINNEGPAVYNLYGYQNTDRRVYGMPGNGQTLRVAAEQAAWVQGLARSTGRALSGAQILTQHGDDLISFGAVAHTAIATDRAHLSGGLSTGAILSGELSNALSLVGASAEYSTSDFTGVLATGGSTPIQAELTGSLAGIITANPAYTALHNVVVDAGAGDDWIVLPKATAQLDQLEVVAGSGDDDILFAQVFNPAAGVQVAAAGRILARFSAVRLAGGYGNDRILLASGDYQLERTTLNGNAGNDRIILSAVAGGIGSGTLLAAGAGNDRLDLNLAGSACRATMAAGLGSDLLAYSGAFLSALLFDGGSDSGNDTIRLDVNGQITTTTVWAGDGDDRISLSAVAGSTNLLEAGAGNDSIKLWTSGGLTQSTLAAGAGNDSISFASSLSLADGFTGLRVIGAAGADLIAADLAAGAITAQPLFVYSAYGDSTAEAMDTIAVGISGGQTLQFALELNTSLALASFSATGYAATNGVVRFSGDAPGSSFAQRFAAVDAAIPQPGRVALFAAADGRQYLFVQGGTESNLVVQVGVVACSGSLMNDAQLQLAGGHQLALSLASGQ